MNYVEGDDAITVLYHLCGRDSSVEKPYAAYNSGLDFLMNYVPINEPMLRSFAIHISFFFGWLVLCFSAIFLDIAFASNRSNSKYAFLYLLPFVIPDFIFHSLIINSSNISFSFALLSLIFYMLFLKKGGLINFILSILFIGIAIPFRWSILSIFPVYYALLILYDEKSIFYRIKITILHSALAILFGILAIIISGYDGSKLLQTILSGKNYLENSELSLLSLFAMGVAFFTFTFLTLLVIGLFVAFYKQPKQKIIENAALLFLPFIPFVIISFLPSFKFIISTLPILLFFAMGGYLYIAKSKLFNGIFVLMVVFTWFVGVKIYASGTATGPGYEMRVDPKLFKKEINEHNINNRIKVKGISLDFDGGFLLPMLEGPRPFYGFYYVLFGGGWKQNIDDFTLERTKAMKILTSKKDLLFLQDRKTAFMQCDLFKVGYHTNMAFQHDAHQNLEYRDFIKDNDTIRLYVIPDTVSKSEFAKEYIQKNNNILFRSSYSSIILGVMGQDPSLTVLGPYTLLKE